MLSVISAIVYELEPYLTANERQSPTVCIWQQYMML